MLPSNPHRRGCGLGTLSRREGESQRTDNREVIFLLTTNREGVQFACRSETLNKVFSLPPATRMFTGGARIPQLGSPGDD